MCNPPGWEGWPEEVTDEDAVDTEITDADIVDDETADITEVPDEEEKKSEKDNSFGCTIINF
jgi:hypothetical protein